MHDLDHYNETQQEEVVNTIKVTNKEFAIHDGPFVKGLVYLVWRDGALYGAEGALVHWSFGGR